MSLAGADIGSTTVKLVVLDEAMTTEPYAFALGFGNEDLAEDITKVINKLVDANNSVVVIEHNLDVIKVADYIIDLGPEGGDGGGEVVATGTPEEVAEVKESYTGQYLKKILKKG